jgi:hypothetical protein
VFPSTTFSHPGPIASMPRVHVTSVNWIIVRDLQYMAIDHQNHDVAPGLIHFNG